MSVVYSLLYGLICASMIDYDLSSMYSYSAIVFGFLWSFLFNVPQSQLIFNAIIVYMLEAINLILEKYLQKLDNILHSESVGYKHIEAEIIWNADRGLKILDMIKTWIKGFEFFIFLLTAGFLYTEVISCFLGFSLFEVLYDYKNFSIQRCLIGISMSLIFLCALIHQVKVNVQGQRVTNMYKSAREKWKKIQIKYSQ